MDLGALLEAFEKELKNERQSSNIKKADLLFSIKCEIENCHDLSKLSNSIEQISLYLASQPTSAPIRRLIKLTLKSYLEKSKSTRIQSILQDLLKNAQSLKHSLPSKLTSIDVIGFLYKTFGLKLVSPPNEEFLESCKKLFKSIDLANKKTVIKSLNYLLQSRPNNLSQSSSEFLKFYMKAASVIFRQEKNIEIRNLTAKGLVSLSQNFPQVFQGQFETCLQTCLKMTEENSSSAPGILLGEILSLYIDTGLNGHSFTNQRKSLDQFPKTLNDLNYLITQYMIRLPSHESRAGLIIAADLAYQKHLKKSIPSQAEGQSFIESFLNICFRISSSEAESWWSVESMTWLIRNMLNYASQTQTKLFFDLAKSKLISLSQSDSYTESDPQRYSSEYLIICTLRLLSSIVEHPIELNWDFKDLEKAMISLLKIPRVQLQVSWTFQSFITRRSGFILPLLSFMVTNTTMAYAELECLRSQSYSKETLHAAINQLIGISSCLSTIIRLLMQSDRGVPVEETDITFNTIKSLVSSEYLGDIIDEEKMFCAEPALQEIDNAKRQAAWVLVDGLMSLGPLWVGSRLNFLFKLWKLPFGRKTCILETVSPMWIIGEVHHKKSASCAMLSFMKYNRALLQPQILKLLIVYLSNALQFLSPAKNSTQHRQFLEQNCSAGVLNELKKNLYECLLLLPSNSISAKINLILNPIYSEIVTEKTNTQAVFFHYSGRFGKKTSGMMQLVETWLSSEEVYIHTTRPVHYMHSLGLLTHEGSYDSWEYKEPSSQFSDMLSAATRLFAEIFTNSSLNVSNRQKLFTFISQHLATSVKTREVNIKSNKICTILLALHGCLMKLSTARGVITDSVLTGCIKNMLNSVEGLSNPLVKCLFSESMIYLCKVMSEAQYIPVFMKEIEHRIILSETSPNVKSGIVMQVGNIYKHFDINLLEKNQDSLGHIIQSISRDENVGAWALHALLKAYITHKNKIENIFKATFPLGYHHYLNENPAEFKFSDTMMLLSQKYLMICNNKNDAFYPRARLIWQDTWRKSELAYSCAKAMARDSEFNIKEVIDFAIKKVPEKESVLFICSCDLEAVYSKFTLFEWFRIYDKGDSQVSYAVESVINYCVDKDQEVFDKLKLIILSVEKELEDENKGLAAFNDREVTQQTVEYFTEKSKIFATKKVIFLVSTQKERFEKLIEDLINFSVHLTSFSQELCIKGLELAVCIFKTYAELYDKDEPDKMYLEIFEALISATIRENLDSPNLSQCVISCQLLKQFLTVPGTHDTEVINRIIKNLVNSLSTRSKEGYTESKAIEIYTLRLYVIAKSLLKAPSFVSDVIKQYSPVLLEHFIILLKDMCVLFTQSKNTLKEHKFLLGKHSISHENVKMGSVEVFIRAGLMLSPVNDLDFFISNIFIFLFLPYSASRENSLLSSEKEVKKCVKRREEILKSLNSIVGLINEPQIVSEVIICLELCEQVPCLRHKDLILEICKNVNAGQYHDLERLEVLIKKIKHYHIELKEKCLEAWGIITMRFVKLLSEKNTDYSQVVSSVLDYFTETIKEKPNLALAILDQIWDVADLIDFQVFVSKIVMKQLWSEDRIEEVLEFLSKKSEALRYFSDLVSDTKEVILRFDLKAFKVISFLVKKPYNSAIFQYYFPFILRVFHLRKPAYSNEETNCLAEVIKLLMTIYLKSSDKAKTLSIIFPLFLSLYHQSYPVPIIKSVSKALTYIYSNSAEAFKENLQRLSEPEKKFIESQLESQTSASVKTPSQPSITLSLRFKKN